MKEAGILKLSWRLQNFEMLELWNNCSGKLLSGNKNHSNRKYSAALNKAERNWRAEEHFENRYGDVSLEISQLALVLFRSTISS